MLCLSIDYSDKYSDDHYEYRHVTLPRELAKYIPKDYWDPATRALRLLADEEWRGIGITQSMGWEQCVNHSLIVKCLLKAAVSQLCDPW